MEVECCGGACGDVVIDVVGLAAEHLREDLCSAVLDDIKMGVAIPIVEGYLDDHDHNHDHDHDLLQDPANLA